MGNEDIPPGDAPSPEPSAAFDWGTWASEAGFDDKSPPDAADVSAALDFHRRFGQHETLYTPDDLDKRTEERIQQRLRDPDTHKTLQEYFGGLLESQGWKRPGGEPQSFLKNDDEGQVQLDQEALVGALEKRLMPRFQRFDQVLGELVKEQEARQQAREDDEWFRGFSTKIDDAVKRYGNGVIAPDLLNREIRRRFLSRELRDESERGLAQAVRTLVAEKLKERQDYLGTLGINIEDLQEPVPPQTKLEDVLLDDNKMDALAERILGNNVSRVAPRE